MVADDPDADDMKENHTDVSNRKSEVTGDGTDVPTPGRRQFMQMAGTAAASVLALGSASAVDTSNYGTVVDIVEQGGDPNGNERVDALIEDLAGDDTLLMFPDGEYLIRDLDLTGLTNFGLAAADGASPTFVAAAQASNVGNKFLQLHGSNILLENIDFDFTASGHGGRIELIAMSGNLTCRNVEIQGSYPDGTDGFRFDVRDGSGTGLVENVLARGGVENEGNRVFGMYVGYEHAGDLTIRNCEMWGFPNNGLYGSGPGQDGGGEGAVKVEGGLYKNNNIANVRLGTPGSYAQNVTVVVDQQPPANDAGAVNVRGIRLRDHSDILVEDCDISIDYGPGDGGVVLSKPMGGSRIRNTRVEINQDGLAAIKGKPPENSHAQGTTFENLSITGSASDGQAVALTDRDDIAFYNCCIQQDGSNRDGIRFNSISSGTVSDTNISVDGENIVLSDSDVDTSNVTSGDSCPVPTRDSDGSNSDDSDGSDSDGSTSMDHTLVLENAGDENTGKIYEFTVTGDLQGESTNPDDDISGSTAAGFVWASSDTYYFNGDIESFAAEDGIGVILDGEQVDPASLGQLPNTLVFEKPEQIESTSYSVQVTGDVVADDSVGSLESDDTVSDGSVSGVTDDTADAYRFSGDIASLNISGSAVVSMDNSSG